MPHCRHIALEVASVSDRRTSRNQKLLRNACWSPSSHPWAALPGWTDLGVSDRQADRHRSLGRSHRRGDTPRQRIQTQVVDQETGIRGYLSAAIASSWALPTGPRRSDVRRRARLGRRQSPAADTNRHRACSLRGLVEVPEPIAQGQTRPFRSLEAPCSSASGGWTPFGVTAEHARDRARAARRTRRGLRRQQSVDDVSGRPTLDRVAFSLAFFRVAN